MTAAPVFVDPTIPGLSIRDLVEKAANAVQTRLDRESLASRHRDFVVKRALAGLDRHQLRDLGLDRAAA